MTTTMNSSSLPIALVTGGGQGIGASICRRLAVAGHRVVVNDLDGQRAEQVADGIRSEGGAADVVVADVGDAAAVEAMFDTIESGIGAVTTLVNNAGISGNAAIRDVTPEFWSRVRSVDLDGVLCCTRRALLTMRDARRGCVVNIASRAWLGWWGQSAYAAAKAGVIGMTRALAVEMGSRTVRLNVVAPGLVETPMWYRHDGVTRAKLLASVPAGTLGTAADVANAVEFLASDRARAITGQVLYVCGGKSVYAYPDWPEPR